MKIAAGIVLYNPEIARLDKNIESIKTQVNEIILFNNGSKNTKQILKYLKNKNVNYILVNSDSNLGIAHALNRLCKEAMKKNYKWLLTLDQDTVVSPNLVHKYSQYVNLPNVGQLSCTYKDRNSSELKYKIDTDVKEVKECITSHPTCSWGYQKDHGPHILQVIMTHKKALLCLFFHVLTGVSVPLGGSRP